MTAADPEFAAIAEAVRQGRRPEAINLAARALKRGGRHPLVLVLAAEGLDARGRTDEAIGLLQSATAAAPGHKVAWMRLAALLARKQRFSEAARAFEAVLELDPNAYPALMGAGEMRLLLRELPQAERHYGRAAEVAPTAGEPLAVLASMAAQARDVAKARRLADQAAKLKPGLLGAEMALVRADLLEGAPGAAELRAARLLARSDLDPENRAGVLDVRAAALDALGRHAEAFSGYEARNAILAGLHADRFAGDPENSPTGLARRQSSFLKASSAADWRARAGDDEIGAASARGHVFLLGFPRSGTTLLEKTLAGHAGAASLEEVNLVARAARDLRGDEQGWGRLARLTPAEADACRRQYWSDLREALGEGIKDRVVVDKLPLHTLSLPIIAKLFPDARILFALRDPRDVVLSCFRRRFRVNSAMFEFLTLNGAAELYDAAMTLAETVRATLPLNLLEVRHESVIADFDGQIRSVLEFIGLDWDPAVRNFAGRVEGKSRTPSYGQLERGLNSDGVGQWRRYQAQMAPALPILEPWAARFGYAAEQAA